MIRKANDVYRTPEWCYRSIKNHIDWSAISASAIEPCAGDGRIAKFMTECGVPQVVQMDINNGTDYLKSEMWHFDLCMTNPPYHLAMQFVEKALSHCDIVIMLLRLSFLASQSRYNFWKQNPITGLYVLSKRPLFRCGTTDNSEYAWFVWDITGDSTSKGIHHIMPNI